ncbi:MAG: GntR family transcriptional regulator [Candidatus Omnitrophica bacterium]|jgi:DNA-binding LacI/PurR family transcriptional regulator|nr:GntR family transcriptional regulator [Candidatus Omnitrophota bacterium]
MSPKVDKSSGKFFYQQFADILRKQVQGGQYKPGEPIPSERILSKEHGINRITLRRGIAQLIREGFLYSVPGTGTFVSDEEGLQKAHTLSSGKRLSRRKNIACILRRLNPTSQSPILSPYYVGIFSTMQKEALKMGCVLSFNFVTSIKDERDIARWAMENNVDGIIVIGGLDKTTVMSLYDKKFPLVLVDNEMSKPAIDSVIPDNRLGGYLAVKHLTDLGHKRIAMIRAPLQEQPASIGRLEGYKEALQEAGIKYDDSLVIEGYYQVEEGYKAMEKILKKSPLPTAVFAINDEAAMGAMKAVREKASLVIPKDISIVGFDNIEWAALSTPPLTTVNVPKEEMGSIALKKLVDRIEGRIGIATKEVVPVDLIVRQSTARPK